jgi:hypothetical protein
VSLTVAALKLVKLLTFGSRIAAVVGRHKAFDEKWFLLLGLVVLLIVFQRVVPKSYSDSTKGTE